MNYNDETLIRIWTSTIASDISEAGRSQPQSSPENHKEILKRKRRKKCENMH